MELRTNVTNLKPQQQNRMDDCCDNNGREDNNVGPDTVVHLVVGLVMLAGSIYSASLTCLAKDDRSEGQVWGPHPQPGTTS